MTSKAFLKAGHWPTLLASFLYFDVSFMVWVLLGPLSPFLAEQLHLTASQKGLLVAIPLLSGSFFRPVLGTLADRIGGRRAGLLGLSVTLLPLLLGWRYASSFEHFLGIGALLGVAGASFAVALPLASRWYPPEYQGLAMGIAGAGNSGTLLATLFMPRIATHFGWHNAFAFAAVPVLLVLVAFALLARESPAPKAPVTWKQYKALLAQADTGWFCLFYSITFGGFVGLASFLTVFFVDQYHLSKVQAGDFVTLIVVCGSFLRPVGGWLADRAGGYRVLLGVLLVAGAGLCALSTLPALGIAVAVLGLIMAMLGLGNGAIFQLVPQRFAGSVGTITGLVGAAGGIGGFLLPSQMGYLKDHAGSYGAGLLAFGGLTLVVLCVLLRLGAKWLQEWPEETVRRAGLFSLRSVWASEPAD
ncbi:nitrate/nitrite transporter [Paludibaculum fermentans]|uniref:NarK/NasA family nitrate transporter n=1 Tax=Paludibaculum fermentans TaxID=1473598 RepID=A0A7S7SQ05_PALFE|nr:nitrate/nitrite transporter [Paludibaculum fermentans]QOY91720.1 NarK/NasA family nitrate transporter [Paludibaculum fermentans]